MNFSATLPTFLCSASPHTQGLQLSQLDWTEQLDRKRQYSKQSIRAITGQKRFWYGFCFVAMEKWKRPLPLSPGNYWKTPFLWSQVRVPKRECPNGFPRKHSAELPWFSQRFTKPSEICFAFERMRSSTSMPQPRDSAEAVKIACNFLPFFFPYELTAAGS